ncbi:unnamed protein product, partial [Owenia fusiformis]
RKSKMGKSSTRRSSTPLQDESDVTMNALMELEDTTEERPASVQQATQEGKPVVSRKRKLETEESSQLAKKVSSLEERITRLRSKLVQVCEQQSTDMKAPPEYSVIILS